MPSESRDHDADGAATPGRRERSASCVRYATADQDPAMHVLSIVLPAKNEEAGLTDLLGELVALHPDAEIILVDDGSTDATASIARGMKGVRCLSHPVSIGNGGAVKTGARAATGRYIVFMDADGQHRPADVARLVERLDAGFDLAVGARSHRGQASSFRAAANGAFNRLASYMTGFRIADLTSGFRAVRRERFLSILYLLPNKFSYPTTSTMAFFRSGYFVDYVPVEVRMRQGTSHVKLFRDGVRFLIIILKIGSLFSPMRLFLPVSAALFAAASLYYLHTFVTEGRFTNMGMLLYISSLLTFLIGIVAEQVSALHYRDTGRAPNLPADRDASSAVEEGPVNVLPFSRTTGSNQLTADSARSA